MVPGSEITGGGINDVVFSPDGKHYAARYKMANQREYVFADGKRGLDYQSLSSMQAPGVTPRVVAFTADSSKVVYVAANGSGQFLVIGDQEIDLPLNADETVIGPVGSHVATAGQGMVTIDGKVLSFPGISPTTSHANYLKFSPDGSHFAFALTDRGGVTLVLDGVAQSGYRVIADNYVPFMFSADSKHIAYICRPARSPPIRRVRGWQVCAHRTRAANQPDIYAGWQSSFLGQADRRQRVPDFCGRETRSGGNCHKFRLCKGNLGDGSQRRFVSPVAGCRCTEAL